MCCKCCSNPFYWLFWKFKFQTKPSLKVSWKCVIDIYIEAVCCNGAIMLHICNNIQKVKSQNLYINHYYSSTRIYVQKTWFINDLIFCIFRWYAASMQHYAASAAAIYLLYFLGFPLQTKLSCKVSCKSIENIQI